MRQNVLCPIWCEFSEHLAHAQQLTDSIGQIGLRSKRVGVKLFGRQLALGDEIALRRIDHNRRAAGINLMLRQVREVGDDGLMHEAVATAPVVFRLCIRHHRHITEVRQVPGPFFAQCIHVQVLRAAAAPVQGDRTLRFGMFELFDDGLDRRKTGARCQQYNRFLRIFAQEEGAQRTFKAQDVAFLEGGEDLIGKQAARHVADVQRQMLILVRRVGHAVAAALAVAQHEFDILAGLVLQAVIGRQLQRQDDDVIGHFIQFGYPYRHFLDREFADAGHFACFDGDVRMRFGAAEQGKSRFFILGGQCAFLMRAMGDAAAQQFAAARTAGAVFTAVRQADAGADGGIEDRFALIADKLMAAGLNCDLKTHTILIMKDKLKKIGKPRLLILGCGDVGMRLLPLVRTRFRVFVATSKPERCAELRAAGAIPVVADLDHPASLARLARLAPAIVHLAPPPAAGALDRRTRNLAAILPDRAVMVYISTTGVYGDCGGASFDETRATRPQNERAKRRVDAETVLRAWARRSGSRLAILRVPGIYAQDRLPTERLRKALPALNADEDVYTNHIHADDLARIAATALFRGAPLRIYHAVDDSDMKMGEYFDAVARALKLPLPPRLSRAELTQAVSPVMLSFMSESRRLRNTRLRAELGIRLQFDTVQHMLDGMATA